MSAPVQQESQTSDQSVEVKVLSLSGQLSQDQKRVLVRLDLSDASQRPDVELSLLDMEKNEITSAIILGVMSPSLSFTLHLGKYAPTLPVLVSARVRKGENEILDQKIETVQ